MPLFYIHFRHGDLIAKDDEGIELSGLEEALETALLSAREIIADQRASRPESELQPGFLISGGSDQLTFLVTLGESCSASGSISALGLVSLFRLKARPMRPNAIRKIPAIISQCGYSSARSICPHKEARLRSVEEKLAGAKPSAGGTYARNADRVCPLPDA
jgi:hypothetical protein